jgi:hypothetical protein
VVVDMSPEEVVLFEAARAGSGLQRRVNPCSSSRNNERDGGYGKVKPVESGKMSPSSIALSVGRSPNERTSAERETGFPVYRILHVVLNSSYSFSGCSLLAQLLLGESALDQTDAMANLRAASFLLPLILQCLHTAFRFSNLLTVSPNKPRAFLLDLSLKLRNPTYARDLSLIESSGEDEYRHDCSEISDESDVGESDISEVIKLVVASGLDPTVCAAVLINSAKQKPAIIIPVPQNMKAV